MVTSLHLKHSHDIVFINSVRILSQGGGQMCLRGDNCMHYSLYPKILFPGGHQSTSHLFNLIPQPQFLDENVHCSFKYRYLDIELPFFSTKSSHCGSLLSPFS